MRSVFYLFRPLSPRVPAYQSCFNLARAAEAISWNDYFWDVVDAVLASLGTDSYSFPSDFVRSVVDTEPGHVASEMASLGRKLYCAEHSGVSLEQNLVGTIFTQIVNQCQLTYTFCS